MIAAGCLLTLAAFSILGYCGVYPNLYPKTFFKTFQFVSNEGLKRLVLLIEFKSVSTRLSVFYVELLIHIQEATGSKPVCPTITNADSTGLSGFVLFFYFTPLPHQIPQEE